MIKGRSYHKVRCGNCGKVGQAYENELGEVILPDGWQDLGGEPWCFTCTQVVFYDDFMVMEVHNGE